MAGIGFELRKLLRRDTYLGLLGAYGYAGLIGSGPWVLSILAVMALGLLTAAASTTNAQHVTEFLVSVTWLVAASLTLTGMVQLLFTRFVADRLFEGERQAILPNLLVLLTLVTIASSSLGVVLLMGLFGDTSPLYRLAMLISFVLLCNIWCVTVFVTDIRAYHQVLAAFALGYGSIVVLGLWWQQYGLDGLIGAFAIGQALLLYTLLFQVIRHYPSQRLWEVSFTRRHQIHPSLILIGLCYNLGIWVDKLAFWFSPATSEVVIGPLRASPIYDLPIFLAYLSIVPGMAVFLLRMETDFAEHCSAYYDTVRGGGSLERIEALRLDMLTSVQRGIYDIFKVQGITVVALLLGGPYLLDWLGFSPWYLPLFNIFVVAVAIQVLFLAILNVLFYLDRLAPALGLCLLFLFGNLALTLLSQRLGPTFYGYGYAVSLLIASLTGLMVLDREFRHLTYQTFMLQRQGPTQRRRHATGAEP